MEFLDIQQFLIWYLATLDGITETGTLLPPADDFTPDRMPFVSIRRSGGPDDDITDFPNVEIQVFASTDADAQAASEIVRQGIRALRFARWGNVAVDRTRTLVGPYWADYGDDNFQRYIAVYQIESRILTD